MKRAAFVLLLAVAAVGCAGDAAPSDAFGVNVTVDAQALGTDARAAIKSGRLLVQAPSGALTPNPIAVGDALAGGEARFHYTPLANTGAVTLVLSFEGLAADGTTVLASGTGSPVTLIPGHAVASLIPLHAGALGDGGLDAGGGVDGPIDAGGIDAPISGDGPPPVGGNRANGVACVQAKQCASGFCVDGVCCNSACAGLCESCAIAPRGTCTPLPDGTDPQNECPAEAVPDGGSGGGAITPPDGGISSTPELCHGVCNGAGACRYPGEKKSCGTSWCDSDVDVAELVCDGHGNCGPELAACVDYACGGGACKTVCAKHDDCQAGKTYCNAMNKCVPKKANSVMCATGVECASGFCVGGVCCNSACEAPSTCTETPGLCKCPGVTCGAGIACQVFYRDADADGYGDKFGALADGSAAAGCTGTPPAGFVADHSDCDDGDANAHPKQTAYFDVPSQSKGTYDYDCDGTMVKEYPDALGVACKFCMAGTTLLTCGTPAATCSSAGQRAGLSCGVRCTGGGGGKLGLCSCQAIDGFAGAVACGVMGEYRTCGTCLLPGGGATSTAAQKKQACR